MRARPPFGLYLLAMRSGVWLRLSGFPEQTCTGVTDRSYLSDRVEQEIDLELVTSLGSLID